jgi:hypothetical protein
MTRHALQGLAIALGVALLLGFAAGVASAEWLSNLTEVYP